MFKNALSFGSVNCKIRYVRIWLTAIFIPMLLGLSGCSTVGPDFNSMTEAYENAIDIHQKKSLLSNMLRASSNLPLVFTDVTTVTGTGSIATSASANANFASLEPATVAGFLSADKGSSFGASSSLSTNRAFTFSLGSLNNVEFFRGFLTNTPLEDLYFYMKSDNPPKELIGSILIDSIEMEDDDGNRQIFINDPMGPDYAKFVKALYILIDDGLSAEMQSTFVPIGPTLSSSDFQKLLPEFSKLVQAKLMVKKVSDSPEKYQIVMAMQKANICFERTNTPTKYNWKMECAEGIQGKQPKKLSREISSAREKSLVVHLRSTKSVFTYLGKIIALQRQSNPQTITIRVKGANGLYEEQPILRVLKNMSTSEEVITTVGYQGDQYSVPSINGGFSASVFQLLSVMVTMNKIPGSIPASPGVLIR